jgi:hypothetical protein
LLTIFSIPKPFEGHIGMIQRNAIRSWSVMDKRFEIILFGNEAGTAEMAGEIKAKHHIDVALNECGTPLVNTLFETAARIAENSTLCYINADIILMSDFTHALRIVESLSSFLMVGRRWDVDIDAEIDFSDAEWERRLRSLIEDKAALHPATGIDYFVFNRELWGDTIPSFAVGRTTWDNWFIYQAKRLKAPVIDATREVMAVHQNHGYNPIFVERQGEDWRGPEVQRNQALAGNMAANYNSADADNYISKDRLARSSLTKKARRYVVIHNPNLARKVVRFLRRIRIYPDTRER